MVPYIGMRTLMSKIVPHHELGQSNSVFGLSESFMPFIFGPLYTTIYKFTIEVLPGAYFLVTAFMKSIGICLFLCLYFETRKNKAVKTSRFTSDGIRQSDTVI
ncbi:hypothetical protein WA026_022680 [Henosepilachna vigintioctopunctata]|uniref:Uncharacterized protein n=1 Tax=Henosepilachna vigintioctopunctata TaxID=420089 RepID=A0AAW1U238_9CUCU